MKHTSFVSSIFEWTLALAKCPYSLPSLNLLIGRWVTSIFPLFSDVNIANGLFAINSSIIFSSVILNAYGVYILFLSYNGLIIWTFKYL